METVALEDLDEVDLLLTELEISQGKGNLILCTVASPAYRDRVIEAIKRRFPVQVMAVENGDALIWDLRSIKPDEKTLIWTLPDTLSQDILDALNNFRELFYDSGVPSLVFMTPSALDEVIWKAPDFWRYRGGYHILKGEEYGHAYQALEALSTPFDFNYQNKEELLRRKSINEYLLKKINDKRELVRILKEIGTIHYLLSEFREAIEYYEQALKISREIGGRSGEGSGLRILGLAYARLGETRKAIEFYEQALKISREIGDRSGEGTALGNLGNAYADLGEPRKAIEYHEQALKISREIGDRRGEGADLGNLGNAYADLGDSCKAIEHYQMALAITREIGDRRGEGNSLGNLGLVYAELDQIPQAIECAKSALTILEAIESPHAEKVKRKLQEWEEASNQIQ